MMFIQNVTFHDVNGCSHKQCDDRAVLIQIVDPAYGFPTPAHAFASVLQLEFLDEDETCRESLHEFLITDAQAASIIDFLQMALQENRDVIVHCHAGLCRSGAVADVGIMMGFEDTGKIRLPNRLVKHKLMQQLGWTYD